VPFPSSGRPGAVIWRYGGAPNADSLRVVDRQAQLQEWLAKERGHLAAQHEPHFHIAVWTDNENEWEVARFISSPPYRDRTLAESDAHGSDLLERVGSFNVDVVACDRACPRSGLGVFGYEDEDHAAPPWWSSWKPR